MSFQLLLEGCHGDPAFRIGYATDLQTAVQGHTLEGERERYSKPVNRDRFDLWPSLHQTEKSIFILTVLCAQMYCHVVIEKGPPIFSRTSLNGIA